MHKARVCYDYHYLLEFMLHFRVLYMIMCGMIQGRKQGYIYIYITRYILYIENLTKINHNIAKQNMIVLRFCKMYFQLQLMERLEFGHNNIFQHSGMAYTIKPFHLAPFSIYDQQP